MGKLNSTHKRLFGLLIIAVAAAAFYLTQPPKGYKYILPDGFTGWACIHFEVPGAAPLQAQGEYELITIPQDGIVQTSSAMRDPHSVHLGFFVSGNGVTQKTNELIQGGRHIQKPGKPGTMASYIWITTPQMKAEHTKIVEARLPHIRPSCGTFQSTAAKVQPETVIEVPSQVDLVP